MQARCAELLESSGIHYTIIGLTLLDLAIVVTELILSSIFPAAEAVPHAGGGLETGWQCSAAAVNLAAGHSVRAMLPHAWVQQAVTLALTIPEAAAMPASPIPSSAHS